VWKDRQVERPMTFVMQENADGTTTLIPVEGTIVESGTPLNAINLNNLEMQFDEAKKLIDSFGLIDPSDFILKNGILNMQKQPAFQLNLSSAAPITTVALADTLLPFNGSGGTHGADSFIDGTYIVPEDGVYEFKLSLSISIANGANMELKLFKNSSLAHWMARYQNNSGNTFTFVLNGSSLKQLAKGDIIKFYIYTTVAATIDRVNTWASVAKIA
jgi:hypothetical protein